MIEAQITTVSTSNADDLAFRALADICALTRDIEVRIVGGQMVNLLLGAFPSANAVVRRTADADAAIGTQLAASGEVHELLTATGYVAESGNSYVKNGQRVDVLIPDLTGHFRSNVRVGDRSFDAAPGLALALTAKPMLIRATIVLTNDAILEVEARVPPVETAVVLKAASFRSRRAPRDLTDLHNLLLIVEEHSPEEFGGWRLSQPQRGSRGDAQRDLREIAHSLSRRPGRLDFDASPESLVALIRTHVASAA